MTENETATAAMATLRQDPALEPYVEQYGPLYLEPADDIFQRLVVSVIRQQVSMDAAAAIRERLFAEFDVSPETLRDADPESLAAVGLSEAKVGYVKAVAETFLEQRYSRKYFAGMDDRAVLDELTAIRGIGPWTGKMFLMFGLGREDVFPVEDLGVRRGMEIAYDAEMTRQEMTEEAVRWQPYRSYAALYLWRAYEG